MGGNNLTPNLELINGLKQIQQRVSSLTSPLNLLQHKLTEQCERIIFFALFPPLLSHSLPNSEGQPKMHIGSWLLK
jgi:hypothetical protein